MGGVRSFSALVLALAHACSPAHATDVRALVREKAAAVAIMREKAANQIGTLAQDRVFGAYLNATTQSEGLRLKGRIETAFATINKRFGLRTTTLIARDGRVVAYAAGRRRAVAGQLNLIDNAALTAGFALEAMTVSTRVAAADNGAGLAVSHISPVVWRGNAEFVLRGEQDFGSYKAVLTPGQGQYVALIDERRAILSDAGAVAGVARAGGALSVAGLSFDAIRRAVKGSAKAGGGEVAGAKRHFNVGYQSVGPWTVVAVEAAALPRRCPTNGARICG